MKIRLILQDRSWEHQLRVKQQQPGRYYVELVALDGTTLEPSIFTGSFASLDVIVAGAESIYLQLVAMKESANRPVTAAMLEAPLLNSNPKHNRGHAALPT